MLKVPSTLYMTGSQKIGNPASVIPNGPRLYLTLIKSNPLFHIFNIARPIDKLVFQISPKQIIPLSLGILVAIQMYRRRLIQRSCKYFIKTFSDINTKISGSDVPFNLKCFSRESDHNSYSRH